MTKEKKCCKPKKTTPNQHEISELKQKLQEAENSKLRALADLENYKRRENENKKNWSNYAVAEFLKTVLPSLLEFELFAQNSSDENASKSVQKLFDQLQKSGLEKISPQKNEEINPDFHAVLLAEQGKEGKVVQTLEAGWKFQDIVLKPAKVSGGKEEPTKND